MYQYKQEKTHLFSDEGQRMFLKIRDFVHEVLKKSGAITMEKAIAAAGGGSAWTMMACVDRMVELGELREINQDQVAGQGRIFVSAR